MKVQHTIYGRLTGALGGPFGVVLGGQMGPRMPWQAMLAIVLILLAVGLRATRRGVFDAPDGGVVVKRTFATTHIAASAEPVIAFDKALVGYRLLIATNGDRRIRTGIRVLKPALNVDLTPPANLLVPAAAEAHIG